MLDGSTLGAGSDCLSTSQLQFEEAGISFAQGSRAIHFIMNGAPQSRNPGGARELSGTKQQKTAPPPWRPEEVGVRKRERDRDKLAQLFLEFPDTLKVSHSGRQGN